MAGCSAPCSGIKPVPSTIEPPPPPNKKSCPLPEAPEIFAPPCLEKRPYRACPASPKATSEPCGPGKQNKSGGKGGSPSGKMLGVLTSIREPLADHQAGQGLPKDEQYTFVELVKNLCTHSYEAVLAIFTMLYNLIPFLDGFLYLLRFILDKLIEIFRCETKTELVLSTLMFLVEMFVIVLFLMLMTTFIIVPVWNLSSSLLGKFSLFK